MIVRSIDEIAGSDRDRSGPGWRSRRILLRADGMHHSLHYTEITPGVDIEMRYAHHLESNLCIAGEGEVIDLATAASYPVRPGVMYALDKHDHHLLRASTPMTLVCVFYPALTGHETHDATGGYPPGDDA
jgi:L-ectoine synthase